jgi:hypothetical protein
MPLIQMPAWWAPGGSQDGKTCIVPSGSFVPLMPAVSLFLISEVHFILEFYTIVILTNWRQKLKWNWLFLFLGGCSKKKREKKRTPGPVDRLTGSETFDAFWLCVSLLFRGHDHTSAEIILAERLLCFSFIFGLGLIAYFSQKGLCVWLFLARLQISCFRSVSYFPAYIYTNKDFSSSLHESLFMSGWKRGLSALLFR